MATGVKLFRSSDSNAPILTGQAGSLAALLKACLVDGYGSVRASGTITSSGVNVSDGDTVTVDGTVYTFKTALTPSAGQVLIGASAAASLANLVAALGGLGTVATTYATGTTYQSNIQVTSLTATVITLTALKGGTGGNSLALAKSAATLTVSGATLSGGSGTDTQTGAGWSNPYRSANQYVFRAGGGSQSYLDVHDGAPDSASLARHMRVRGYETMTAVATGTNPFPTAAQVADGNNSWRKSATLDQTARVWYVLADDRTVYVFAYVGDLAGTACGGHFGDIYSFKPSDSYKAALTFFNTALNQTLRDPFINPCNPGAVAFTAHVGANCGRTYIARAITAVAGAVSLVRSANIGSNQGITGDQAHWGGQNTFPNPGDAGFYVAPYNLNESSPASRRGFLRGIWLPDHSNPVVDGDTFSGSGAYAGRTFLALTSVTANIAMIFLVETSDTWETSS